MISIWGKCFEAAKISSLCISCRIHWWFLSEILVIPGHSYIFVFLNEVCINLSSSIKKHVAIFIEIMLNHKLGENCLFTGSNLVLSFRSLLKFFSNSFCTLLVTFTPILSPLLLLGFSLPLSIISPNLYICKRYWDLNAKIYSLLKFLF